MEREYISTIQRALSVELSRIEMNARRAVIGMLPVVFGVLAQGHQYLEISHIWCRD